MSRLVIMPKIHILPENLCNKIAAGEIVERPASVVKELVENAIDAGATQIYVEAEDSGRRLIRVSDNGEGMEPEDARQAFLRHATSKLRTESDLTAIRTMGFRGEALPSIGSVARVRMVSARAGGGFGTEIRIRAGIVEATGETAAPAGTLVEVEDLFYNTPARKKFLKSHATELSHIVHTVQQEALPHFGIHFRLTHNGIVLLDLPIVRDEMERAAQAVGPNEAADLLEVSSSPGAGLNGFRFRGLISKPGQFRATREHQEFFLNRRAVKNASLSHAVGDAYGTLLAKGRHPVAYLFVVMDPAMVDVNVHPAKREVRFRDAQAVHRVVKDTLRERLRGEGLWTEGTAPQGAPYPDLGLTGMPASPGEAGPAPAGWSSASGAPAGARPGGLARESLSMYRPLEGSEAAARSAAALYASESGPGVRIQALGQVDRTYIVANVAFETESELHLIDQHAAHERLLYERLLSQQRSSGIELQPLLIPEVAEFGAAEALRLREILPVLGRIGLEVEEFGDRSFRIRAVPALLGTVDGKTLLRDILDEVAAGAAPEAEETIRSVAASMACHAAIKAHQPLGPEQMTRLLEDLYRHEVPPTCPHGRPIRARFTLPDLEKLFQRR